MNEPLAFPEWFAIYLKMSTYVRNPQLQITVIGVTEFQVIYTENYEGERADTACVCVRNNFGADTNLTEDLRRREQDESETCALLRITGQHS